MIELYKEALDKAYELWLAGGWAMYPLAINAFILYAKAGQIFSNLKRKGFKKAERLANKAGTIAGQSKIAENYLLERGIDLPSDPTLDETAGAFEELKAIEMPTIERDLRFLKVTMSAAPLWGLLGTVTGMLFTFDGLSKGGGGDKTMNLVASGISEALITTQTGLVIALPGYFFFYYLKGKRDRFQAFVARLESAYTQVHLNKSGPEPSKRASKFRGEISEEDDTEIDISPLIDCVFILLIFFIVTTVFVQEPGVELNKPLAISAEQLQREAIIIGATPDGNVVYGGDEIGVNGVAPLVKRMLNKDPNTPVIVQIDENTPAELFIRVVSEAKKAEAKRVNVSTKK